MLRLSYSVVLRSFACGALALHFLVTGPPARAEAPTPQLELKLKVHHLKSAVPEVNAEPNEAALQAMFDGVNAIWAPAGIHFKLDAVTQDDARDEAAQREFAELCQNPDRLVPGGLFRLLIRIVPELPAEPGVFHLVVVRRFPQGIGGRYFPERGLGLIVTPQLASRRPQPAKKADDGVAEQMLEPKVMAHELGHALGLLHVGLTENLMGFGPGLNPKTWINLTDWQIARSRRIAEAGKPFLAGDDREIHAEETAYLAIERQRGGPFGPGKTKAKGGKP